MGGATVGRNQDLGWRIATELPMPNLLHFVGRAIARYLLRPSRLPYLNYPADLDRFAAVVRAGDVVLVEGNLRISTAIKYLTHSTWSHAALCIGETGLPGESGPQFVEADAVEGVRQISLDRFAGLHLRICRSVGLDQTEIAAVCRFAVARVGNDYDLRNVFDLARYFIPIPLVPSHWRRRMLALGSGEPTKAICSSLIAQAFQAVHYPILPIITHEACANRSHREILHIRDSSLYAPRDFDISPYFQIIKVNLDPSFAPKELRWVDSEH